MCPEIDLTWIIASLSNCLTADLTLLPVPFPFERGLGGEDHVTTLVMVASKRLLAAWTTGEPSSCTKTYVGKLQSLHGNVQLLGTGLFKSYKTWVRLVLGWKVSCSALRKESLCKQEEQIRVWEAFVDAIRRLHVKDFGMEIGKKCWTLEILEDRLYTSKGKSRKSRDFFQPYRAYHCR